MGLGRTAVSSASSSTFSSTSTFSFSPWFSPWFAVLAGVVVLAVGSCAQPARYTEAIDGQKAVVERLQGQLAGAHLGIGPCSGESVFCSSDPYLGGVQVSTDQRRSLPRHLREAWYPAALRVPACVGGEQQAASVLLQGVSDLIGLPVEFDAAAVAWRREYHASGGGASGGGASAGGAAASGALDFGLGDVPIVDPFGVSPAEALIPQPVPGVEVVDELARPRGPASAVASAAAPVPAPDSTRCLTPAELQASWVSGAAWSAVDPVQAAATFALPLAADFDLGLVAERVLLAELGLGPQGGLLGPAPRGVGLADLLNAVAPAIDAWGGWRYVAGGGPGRPPAIVFVPIQREVEALSVSPGPDAGEVLASAVAAAGQVAPGVSATSLADSATVVLLGRPGPVATAASAVRAYDQFQSRTFLVEVGVLRMLVSESDALNFDLAAFLGGEDWTGFTAGLTGEVVVEALGGGAGDGAGDGAGEGESGTDASDVQDRLRDAGATATALTGATQFVAGSPGVGAVLLPSDWGGVSTTFQALSGQSDVVAEDRTTVAVRGGREQTWTNQTSRQFVLSQTTQHGEGEASSVQTSGEQLGTADFGRTFVVDADALTGGRVLVDLDLTLSEQTIPAPGVDVSQSVIRSEQVTTEVQHEFPIPVGSTYAFTAQETRSSTASSSGFGWRANWLLGGGRSAALTRTVVVVAVKVTELPWQRDGVPGLASGYRPDVLRTPGLTPPASPVDDALFEDRPPSGLRSGLRSGSGAQPSALAP